ncbi:MAG TPA: glutamate--tRNA ligase [Acidimicrobiia bacterium]|nr:glutamate--tRNA ligase [Acidimicrobiia bacterium]
MSVRVRFAPSPTGHLHIGGVRTALYNWLFARHEGGTFILRSDDTDTERSEIQFHEDILAGLRWLGLDWDEGLEIGGEHGTYRQSDRIDRYREVARALVESGHAYYDLATTDQLEALRKAAQAANRSPVYRGEYRSDGPVPGTPIRFAIDRPGSTEFEDVVRGSVRFDHGDVDDFVILRSDGTPTYHLASTVDDVDYGITHVIRGEDILPSTPKHIAITAAMGSPVATYAHLALIHGPDGTKLSKRHGHTALRAYREAGYVPDALCNYLAILGWSPGEDQEIIDRDEMVRRFGLSDVSRNPAVFDQAKLEWMNGVYIRAMDAGDFVETSLPLLEEGLGRFLGPHEKEAFAAIAPLVQERAKRLTEVPEQTRFLFADGIEFDAASWDKVMTRPEAPVAVDGALARLDELGEWATDSIEAALRSMLDEHGLSAGKGLQPIRVAVTGSSVSPPLFESLEALGRDRSLARLREAAARMRG